MARVKTNETELRSAVEASPGVLPGSPQWVQHEQGTPGSFGAVPKFKARRPISVSRGRQKGAAIGRTAELDFKTDATVSAMSPFWESLMFAEAANVEFDLKSAAGTLPPPAVAAGTVFTIDAASALLAGKMQYSATMPQTLLFSKGFANAANNGLHVLAADVVATDTSVSVTSALVDETPPTNATVEVAGIRTDDCTLTITGSTATLVSAADVDWTTTGIQAGQLIHIGSPTPTGAVQNAFNGGGTDEVFGYMRVDTITATTLTCSKLGPAILGSGGPHTPETVDVMFGKFIRDVPATANADDKRFLERTHQFERTYPNLGGAGVDEYEYAIGNVLDQVILDYPDEDFVGAEFKFRGQDSEDITATRKTGAAAAKAPLRKKAFSTTDNLKNLTTDLVSAASGVCFKSLTLTIGNTASDERCLGSPGASFINTGLFIVDIDGQMLFTDEAQVNAVRNNTTHTFLTILGNEDGAFGIDIPSLTFEGGAREYPVDQSVLVNLKGAAFTSEQFGHNASVSLFPAVPGVIA